MTTQDNLYFYKAVITAVYDGDTITADIDLGHHAHLSKRKLRLYGIDAPELKQASLQPARQSRDRLRELVLDKEVVLQTIKDTTGKYGRLLANIWIEHDGTTIKVNDLLVEEGHAAPKNY